MYGELLDHRPCVNYGSTSVQRTGVRSATGSADWIPAASKVVTALTRLEKGNTSNVKSVGEGVSELKIDFGPGYRVYFGWHGPQLVILLGGGTKKRQNQDIGRAREYWRDYRMRKAKECH